MKITFKSYDDLKALVQEDGKELDKDFDWFLTQIADKTFPCQNYEVSGGGKIKEFFSINTSEVAHDGGTGISTIAAFEHFKCSKEWLDNVDYEGKKYWACINCGFTVEPTQKYEFIPNKTYEEIGINNCICPLCMTKTLKEVN